MREDEVWGFGDVLCDTAFWSILLWDLSHFPTNLKSFVSFRKTHKLHNAIDHWLAGVTGQAHVALDFITEGERAVDTSLHGDRGTRRWTTAAEVLKGELLVVQAECWRTHWGGCCVESEGARHCADEERLILLLYKEHCFSVNLKLKNLEADRIWCFWIVRFCHENSVFSLPAALEDRARVKLRP